MSELRDLTDISNQMHDWCDRIQPLVDEYLSVSGAPGIALAMVHSSGHTEFFCRGVEAIGATKAVSSQTLFQIGSITKSLIAIALLRAGEQKRCAISDLLHEHLCWLDLPAAKHITLEMLLTHTSGLCTGTSYAIESRVEAYNAVLALGNIDGKFRAKPYYYSNIGYNLLGYVLEAIYQQPLSEVLANEVFSPLAMHDSRGAITAPNQAVTAQGHRSINDNGPRLRADPLVAAEWEIDSAGAGCVISNAVDMSRFVAMLLRRGMMPGTESFVAENTYGSYIQTRIEVERKGINGYGLGLFVTKDKTRDWISHTGGMIGFRTCMIADLKNEFGLVMLTNLGIDQRSMVGWEFASRAMSALPMKLVGESVGTRRLLLVPESDACIGEYFESTRSEASSTWRVFANNANDLQLSIGGAALDLEWFADDRFAINDATLRPFELRFIRNDSNDIIGIQHGERMLCKLKAYGSSQAIERVEPIASQMRFVGTYRARNPWHPILKVVVFCGQLEAHISDFVAPLVSLGSDQFNLSGTPETLQFSMPMAGRFAIANLSGCPFFRENNSHTQ
jgi:D-alanyl-D-alanine carboxypeptidase